METHSPPFIDPHLLLQIRIHKCRSTITTSFWEKLWGCQEYFIQLCCDESEGPTEFYTKPFRRQKDVILDEVFSFVLPNRYAVCDQDLSDPIKIKIRVYQGNKKFYCDFVDASYYKLRKTYSMTIKFVNDQDVIKLDIDIQKIPVTNPDFRFSFNLCESETETLRRRKKNIFESMQHLLPVHGRPKTIDQVPTISIACSGGGYRSTIQFCGVLEALMETGVFDMISYMSGLSGGAWYVLPAYAKEVLNSIEDLKDFHSELKASVKSSMVVDTLVDFSHFLKYRKFAQMKESEGQPVTFADFYSFTLGKSFLGYEKMGMKLSDLRDYVGSGEVPIPIVSALHVRAKESSAQFHANLEITPWEVSMPNYAMNLSTETFGSEWYKGSMVRPCPELPIHFFIGMSSSAFGILLKYYLGGETTETDSSFIEDIRSHEFGRHNTKIFRLSSKEKYIARRRQRNKISSSSDCNQDPIHKQRRRSITRKSSEFSQSSDEDFYDARMSFSDGMRLELGRTFSNTSEIYHTADEDDSAFKRTFSTRIQNRTLLPVPESQPERRETLSLVVGIKDENKSQPKHHAYLKKIIKKISQHPLFTDREAVIDRTAKVLNFGRGLSSIRHYPLNPEFRGFSINDANSMRLSKDDDVVTFIDPAVICNTPTSCLLRPQRNTDILIVCDATEYKSDTDIDYLELFIAERLARQQGIKFPKINPTKLKDNPRGVIHVFEDEDDPDCPIVIWFTLSNKEYKSLKNVRKPPRRWLDEAYKVPMNEKFNEFPVYGPKSCYTTLNTRYTPLQFDRLKEMMKHNISSNIEIIKKQITKKVLQKMKKSEA
uniref:uncharacterized protein LOC120332600 isoform X2 n=1 Tax=Styela clava TaxID=7725 RepID=UPI00193A5147|nr:uncharacterized protein LOC120332600 isoform X2 [Styela clava]